MTATVELVPGAADTTRPAAATAPVVAATARPDAGTRSAAEAEASAGRSSRLRAVVLLLLFLMGCALAAVGAALAVGTVWQEVYAWVMPQVVGDALGG